ncbi:MAG: cytochrome P450 [Nocardioides sp.]|uniref:cytochrome P450 n=1 Tax=Nocardioides sp. TaxID=35761 RepID=UPI0039E30740
MTTADTAFSKTELDDLLSEEAIDRPASYYRKLRDVHPVYWNSRWNGWVVTGYPEVVAGYRDHKRLSSDRFAGPFGEELRRSAEGAGSDQLLGFLSKFFVWKDQPYHTRIRELVNRAFTPRSVEALRPRVQELVRHLSESFPDPDNVDFFTQFSFQVPVIVIAEYLGVPPEARDEVRAWSEDLGAVIFVRGDDAQRMEKGEAAMNNLVEFLRPIVHERRKNPQDDLLSGMVQAEARGDFLSEDEVLANAILMMFAGHETTMNLMANGMVAFHQFPDQWQRLYENPDLARTAVEETLRFDGPIRAMARWAAEPLELGGQQIQERDRVLLVQHAANRDPRGFEDPDIFDISRWPNKHAAFGQGIHTCLGAPLARLETQEAFRHLVERYSGFEILDEELRYNATMISRSLTGLHLRFHTR